jgi:hypothetical protein
LRIFLFRADFGRSAALQRVNTQDPQAANGGPGTVSQALLSTDDGVLTFDILPATFEFRAFPRE